MKKHISKTVSTCYCHLRKLYHLCRLVSQSVMKQLVTSFVLQRIDYYNSLLVNLPALTTACAERCNPSHTWSWLTGSYYTCIEKTPLVAYSVPNTIQNCSFYAPVFSSPLSTIHLRFSQLQDRYRMTSFRHEKSGRHSSTTDQSWPSQSPALLFGTVCLNLLD